MSMSDEQQEVRKLLTKRLRLDLLGPATPDEVLRQNRETREGDTPLSRYLVGILYPAGSSVAAEEDDSANDGGDGEEDDTPEPSMQITGIPKPSSIGLSFAVADDVKEVLIEFRYGRYTPTEDAPPSSGDDNRGGKADSKKQKPTIKWTRTQVAERIPLTLPANGAQSLPGGGKADWLCRRDGTLLVISVFLRNSNPGTSGPDEPEQCLYQPEILVRAASPESAPIVNRAHRAITPL